LAVTFLVRPIILFGIDNMRIIYNITTSLSTVFGMMRPLTAVVPTYIHQDKRFSRGCV
jgi:hypothetical protein